MTEISELGERVAILETLMKNEIPHLQADIKFIRSKMNGYRPPWSVVAIIIILTNVVTALLPVVFE